MLGKGRTAALEKVWMREVEGRLPFPSNAKIYHQLEREGLVQRMETVSHDRFGTLTFAGWQLTHAGRFAYCSTCTDEDSLVTDYRKEGG